MCGIYWREEQTSWNYLGFVWRLKIEILIQNGNVVLRLLLILKEERPLYPFVNGTLLEVFWVLVIWKRKLFELLLHIFGDKVILKVLNFIVKVVVVFIFTIFKNEPRTISGKALFPLRFKRRNLLNRRWRSGANIPFFEKIRIHKATFSIRTWDPIVIKPALILHYLMLLRYIQSFHFFDPRSFNNFFGLNPSFFERGLIFF